MSTPTSPLTPKQAEILSWIQEFKCAHGYSPNWREIAAAFGFASPNAVTGYLAALRKKGYVAWERGRGRTLVVVSQNHTEV